MSPRDTPPPDRRGRAPGRGRGGKPADSRGRQQRGPRSAQRGPSGHPDGNRPPATDPARTAALELLAAVRERGAYANLALQGILKEHRVSGRDAALATELGYGACRALGQLDAVVSACGDRPLAELDGPVLDALRLGTYQLLHTRVPPHAAVSATVGLVRESARPQASGYVNAVLRRVSERDLDSWVEYLAPEGDTDPLARLGLATAHPRWIVSAFADALAAGAPRPHPRHQADESGTDESGADESGTDESGTDENGADENRVGSTEHSSDGSLAELRAALKADGVPPAVHLVARPGLVDRETLIADTRGRAGRYSPLAVYLPEGDPGRIAAIADGRAAVQDEGSQLVALALADAELDGSDTRWLDLAAGPGGKAALLGALAAQRGAQLDAVEKAPHRADLVRRTVDGLPVTVHTVDGRDSGLKLGSYDRVVLDAPCTGLGALRRRPEARWRRTEADVAELVRLQRELLEAASRLVRPGGLVAYITCSPHLSETTGVVERRPETLEVIDARPDFPGVPDLGDGPTVQLWPHRQGTDAMFYALLRRRG